VVPEITVGTELKMAAENCKYLYISVVLG